MGVNIWGSLQASSLGENTPVPPGEIARRFTFGVPYCIFKTSHRHPYINCSKKLGQ